MTQLKNNENRGMRHRTKTAPQLILRKSRSDNKVSAWIHSTIKHPEQVSNKSENMSIRKQQRPTFSTIEIPKDTAMQKKSVTENFSSNAKQDENTSKTNPHEEPSNEGKEKKPLQLKIADGIDLTAVEHQVQREIIKTDRGSINKMNEIYKANVKSPSLKR